MPFFKKTAHNRCSVALCAVLVPILTFSLGANLVTLGTYSLEKVHNVYRLELFFENSEKASVGVYGTRVYSDNSKKATITLQTDDYILSFIGADL